MTAGAAPNLPPGHQLGSPEYRRIAVCLFLAGVVTFASLYAAQPLLPMFVTEFGITPTQSTLAVSVATMGIGVALLVAGPLSEVRGRRGLMLGSLFCGSLIGVACGFAPSYGALLVLRALEGVALAGLPAVALAYLSEELVPQAQARAAGLYIGGNAIGGMSGRLLTGALADLIGWRAGLVVIGVVSVMVAVVVVVLLPRSRRFVPVEPRLATMIATTRAILADRALLALFGIGSVCLGTFLAALNAVAFRLTQPPYSLTVGAAGLVYLVYLLGSASSTMAGRAVSRRGQRAVAPWGPVLLLVGALITLARPLPLLMAGLGVMAIGMFWLHGIASGWVTARAVRGAGAPGQASSMYWFAYYAGASVYGALAGVAWSRVGWSAVVVLCGSLSLVGLALTLYLRRIPPLALPPSTSAPAG